MHVVNINMNYSELTINGLQMNNILEYMSENNLHKEPFCNVIKFNTYIFVKCHVTNIFHSPLTNNCISIVRMHYVYILCCKVHVAQAIMFVNGITCVEALHNLVTIGQVELNIELKN